MPKVEIDYSNTIFYKIFCKDINIKELYVGLTTNFVQRKHGHKQSCKNEKAPNHNCKLYNAIRNAGGWDNWQMEIIAFHNCKDSHEAHKKEQEYFEMLGATLNSIEPLPKPKIKVPIMKIIKEKTILFCESCNKHFSCWKAQETHNNTQKHHKMATFSNQCIPEKSPKHRCDICDYNTQITKDYMKHLRTIKHKNRESATKTDDFVLKNPSIVLSCANCNKVYKDKTGLWRHKKKCSVITPPVEIPSHPSPVPPTNSSTEDMQMNLILELVKQNQEFKNLLIQQSNQLIEQNIHR